MNPQQLPHKQRERAEIARQVEHYLRHGGEIRVIDPPGGVCQPRRNIAWTGREELEILVDRGL